MNNIIKHSLLQKCHYIRKFLYNKNNNIDGNKNTTNIMNKIRIKSIYSSGTSTSDVPIKYQVKAYKG